LGPPSQNEDTAFKYLFFILKEQNGKIFVREIKKNGTSCKPGKKYYLRSGVKLNLRTHRKRKVLNREKDVHNICRGD